ncbi:MAG TPA: DUF4062 domain-containing protein [Longimicrobium sp.]|nr:DUF4062 domain-containing protein [Longimicrobium sp.]
MSGNRLFLSSTKEDLGPYRDVAIHVAQRLGMQVVAMEDFGPDPRAAAALCKEKVSSSELFLALVGHRYGFQPEGFGGSSMVELEYGWAVEAGLPVLLFVVDEEQPWSPKFIDHGAEREKLLAFKQRLRLQHVVAPLTTPERLREDLFVHLPAFKSPRPQAPSPEAQSLPHPPAPYVAHTYTLLQTEQVIGRAGELALLDRWVRDADEPLSRARVLCLVAIGGMGKSAVTWKWFHQHAPRTMQPLAGRLWWSFYEAEADFDRFLTSALAYCTAQPVSKIREISRFDREAQLLAVLDQQPFLLVLDGIERLLIAYAGMDFAHLADDDLDRRTANAVAGARGISPALADSIVGQHRLRKTIDPHVGNFLRKLARISGSRILMTSRLYPSDLQTVTGHELPGCAAEFLRGLKPEDAQALWRAMGVSGTDEELRDLFATFDHYPLLIRALAGEVARFRRAPGDFDAWRRAHPSFDPFALPLVQVKSHVLAHALGSLDENAGEMLRTIAAFRSPTDYDVLVDLFASREEWSVEVLDSVLTRLEDRGLLGWDRRANRYDLHPVVRGVVWTGLDEATRHGVYNALRAYFEEVPVPHPQRRTLNEAQPSIELFNALVGLGRLIEATDLYFERINPTVIFEELGAVNLKVALLQSLFPSGLDSPPGGGLMSAAYSQLGHALEQLGRLPEALDCYMHVESLNGLPPKTIEGNCGYISSVKLCQGKLQEALRYAEKSVGDAQDLLFTYHIRHVAICQAVIGRYDSAVELLRKQWGEGDHNELRRSKIALLAAHYEAAAQRVKSFALLTSVSSYVRIESSLVLAEAESHLGDLEEALALIEPLLQELIANSFVDYEMQARRVLADAYRRRGAIGRAREMLDDLWEMARRGGYRLILADACIVLAEIERDAGNLEAARQAAREAYDHAWCDGPPYAYHRALKRSEELIAELGAEKPVLQENGADREDRG